MSNILSEKTANLAKSVKLVQVAGADDFRDVSLHRQLIVKVNADIENAFYWVSK